MSTVEVTLSSLVEVVEGRSRADTGSEARRVLSSVVELSSGCRELSSLSSCRGSLTVSRCCRAAVELSSNCRFSVDLVELVVEL